MSSSQSIEEEGSQEDEAYQNILLTDIEDRAKWIQSLAGNDGIYGSPININLTYTKPLDLQPLKWHYLDLPCKKMKLSNSGHTCNATWHQERPFLTGGPFLGNYVFSQLHFHWGGHNMEGSEHTVDGGQLPMEMHVVHFKSCYLTQECALKEKDGIAVLTYFFKLQADPNPAVQVLVDELSTVQKPDSAARLDPLPLIFLVKEFVEDYFLYWGSVATKNCVHIVLWLITREPIGISSDQIESFRSLLDTNEDPLLRNFRSVQPQGKRRVFHISPSGSKYSTLLPVKMGD